jgi:flagellar biosynthetic protein FliR
VTLPIAPLLPPAPDVALLSVDGVLITIQQLLIGAALGFALQLVFDALMLGGQLLANGMGLGFAFNLDPLRGVTTPALGQLYVVLGTLVFLALDGHLALLNMLVDSFRGLPVGTGGFDAARARALADWGGILFLGGLRVALPGMTALLVINLAFGVMSRAAPALNLFAVGLPVTLVFGLAIVTFGMPTMGAAFTSLLADAFDFTRALTAPR